jgi:hypothetical protein
MSAKIALWMTVVAVITLFVGLTVKIGRAIDADLNQQSRGASVWMANTVRGAVGED